MKVKIRLLANLTHRSSRGQAIVLLALMMVVIVGIVGLVVDVGGAYAQQRMYRNVADSAALAGAQQLRTASRRTVPTGSQYASARELAMRSAVNQLAREGDPLPFCSTGGTPPYASDVVNCAIPNTPYYVSISAPGLTCLSGGPCDRQRSVQVTVRRPDFGLVFALIFNQAKWNVVASSVAELGYSANYALVTLRPPKPSRANNPLCTPNCDFNDDNIALSGTNTRLTVGGDVGTNTNVTLSAAASIVMDPSNAVYHYDAYVNWTPPPAEKQLSSPIADPNFPIPSRTGPGADTFTDATTDSGRLTSADCDNELANVPPAYPVSGYSVGAGEVFCYTPGIYTYHVSAPPSARVILLTPGLYFFDQGINTGSNVRFIGGYEANSEGVALVFPSGASCSPSCSLDVENSPLVALNAGTSYPDITRGQTATPALDYTGAPITTGGRTPVLMTLIVQKDSRCSVGLTEPTTCPNNLNQLKLPGGGSLYLTGVQYAASDRSTILGGSAGSGYIGLFISWTIAYTGGSQVTFTQAIDDGEGVLRLAVACSPRATCSEDYASIPVP